ncbi:YheC/YheD family protein [Bacillus sp. ISL-47]|uniref:YheC/YheD family protein n=1 Tax=Bacillus sp. ISL-47 TaxID=2819130 RepID=UPI001BEC330C|nr:YheC/YheD family protein [Bacillus sp. ISL-47]MBT2706809.1 YheC/YheD family protein [Pseudomonas sp. ISL-84]
MRNRKKMDKWFKHQLLMEDPSVRNYNPETVTFTKENLYLMLEHHQELIIKPIFGSAATAIRKVTKLDEGEYKVHFEKNTVIIKGLKWLYKYLARRKRGHSIIQACIPLAEVNGRPIDFRYIVQRKKDTADWILTGKHAKIAGSGYFVTNLSKEGSVLSVEEALEKSNIKDVNIQKVMEELDHVSMVATECLARHFEDHLLWGYDLAADKSGRVWIIEANSTPLMGGFKYLKDLSMYETINSIREFNKMNNVK